jgi:hypothetical protein
MRRRSLPTLDWGKLRTHSLFDRPSKVAAADLGRPLGPGATIAALIDNLPDQLAARSLRTWVQAIVDAVRAENSVIAALGGHVIKTGCAPYLIDWLKRGVLTGVVLTGSAAIHDVEMALAGRTSEDVEARLPDGSFGMARETAEFFAAATADAQALDIGLGSALGKRLLKTPCQQPEASLLRAAADADVPCTVHVAVGTDIVHMHPGADGALIGAATMRDFHLGCRMVAGLARGVWMNLGCAVVLPEVFLKAVSIAHNLGHDLAGMTTVDLDMIRQYRARVNVLERQRCRSVSITGHHEVMIPLVHAAVLDRLAAALPVT